MNIRYDRIARVQESMRAQGLAAIMVMNHDDFRWLFGEDRSQPRAIVPAEGPVELVAFAGEEPELSAGIDVGKVQVFTTVGGQIHDVVGRLNAIAAGSETAPGERPRIGMQQWFETPAFLVDMFRKVNPRLKLVTSDAVMDPLRAVKEADELELMTEAQRIAGLGMDRARELIRPGVTAHEVVTEALYAMMRAGAEKTSTPVWANFGIESCMLHGRQSPKPLEVGELAIIDLTPQVEGYCANLARTFVLGAPDERQQRLMAAYREAVEAARPAMVPGVTMAELDAVAHEVYARYGLAEHHVYGLGHGLGLRFEETPAPTIIPPHKDVPLREGMTVTLGHPVLAIPGFGGVRFEDVYRVTPAGGQMLVPYPVEPVIEQ
jgi:Xaa-Pro aminopeptidase